MTTCLSRRLRCCCMFHDPFVPFRYLSKLTGLKIWCNVNHLDSIKSTAAQSRAVLHGSFWHRTNQSSIPHSSLWVQPSDSLRFPRWRELGIWWIYRLSDSVLPASTLAMFSFYSLLFFYESHFQHHLAQLTEKQWRWGYKPCCGSVFTPDKLYCRSEKQSAGSVTDMPTFTVLPEHLQVLTPRPTGDTWNLHLL